jgi:hypothetical protein
LTFDLPRPARPSGSRLMVIGAPIGGTVGAIVGYKLTDK